MFPSMPPHCCFLACSLASFLGVGHLAYAFEEKTLLPPAALVDLALFAAENEVAPQGNSTGEDIWSGGGAVLTSGVWLFMRSAWSWPKSHGGYLEVNGAGCQGNTLCVSTAEARNRSTVWEWQAASHGFPRGEPLKHGEDIQIRSMFSADAGYLETRGRGCQENASFCVSTTRSPARPRMSATWTLERKGGPGVLRDGDKVYLRNRNKNLEGYLRVKGIKCRNNLLCVSTMPTSREVMPFDADSAGQWEVRDITFPEQDPCAVGFNVSAAVDYSCGTGDQWMHVLYHYRPLVLDTTFVSYILILPEANEAAGATMGTASLVVAITKLASWAKEARCHTAVAYGGRAALKQMSLERLAQQRWPETKPPYVLRIRPGLNQTRHVDVVEVSEASDLGAVGLDCLPPRQQNKLDGKSWSLESGAFGSYFGVYGGQYAALRDSFGAPGYLWGSEKHFPVGPTGKFILPKGVTSVIIDVGASVKSTLSMESAQEGTLTILVEPDVVTADFLLKGMQASLNAHALQRHWLIRAAIGPESMGGYATFYHTNARVCSSLLSPSQQWEQDTYLPIIERKTAEGETRKDFWTPPDLVAGMRCTKVDAEDTVPVVPLKELLSRIPDDIPVRLVKVDAQGADVQVLISGEKYLQRVRRVVLECQDVARGDWRHLYPSGHTKTEAVDFMEAQGFVLDACTNQSHSVFREQNCFFDRAT
eukprot:TRINITY_DN58848_c0_g1_i1.p1 TRINITY_DN58848_c0_g1~~TRINITY_DN58848_c0_g1_i1.p1  ORF type:complete len:704 (-),score=77.15 TRINITY_DN58848_c0_g1_i1:501-2612(-)